MPAAHGYSRGDTPVHVVSRIIMKEQDMQSRHSLGSLMILILAQIQHRVSSLAFHYPA